MAEASVYERYEAAFGDLEPPFAFVDLDAFWANADDMLRQAGGKPIRVASKSVRCRPLLHRIAEHRTAQPNGSSFRGLLNLTLPEALWLWRDGFRDQVVAYPWTGATALAELAKATADDPDGAPAVMVDSVDVPAHGSVSFEPGGYHLMCMKPSSAVKPGNSVKMTLGFGDGGTLTADFHVRNAKGE